MALPRGIGYLIALCAALSASPAARPAPSPTTAPTPLATAPPRPIVAAPVAAATAADVRELQRALKADIAAVRPAWWERLIPAVSGLVGVLVGGLLGWLQQRRQLALTAKMQQQQLQENERIGRARAGFESLSKVVDFQAKQVNEFYSPLRLMLRRSGGVRGQLTDQLQAKDPARFTYVREADGRDHLFVVDADGSKTRFRLIEHMHELATSHSELMPLVREIVNIGVTMTTLIDAKGGMAINESDRLNTLLGRYLAHFSILRDVTEKADKNPALLAALRYSVAYPNELDSALEEDMTSLTNQIEAWKRLSRQMWDEASNPSASN